MFAVTIAGGLCMGEPDVCKTPTSGPPVPVPYPNVGPPTLAMPIAEKVLIGGAPALNMGSKIPITNGDQAGSVGGVVSGVFMGPVAFPQGSAKVMIGGMPAVRLTSPTTQNQSNTVGAVLAPSQTVVMVMS